MSSLAEDIQSYVAGVEKFGSDADLEALGAMIFRRRQELLGMRDVSTFERGLVLTALQEIVGVMEPFAKRADYFDDKPWISEDNLYADDPPSDIYLSQLREAREKLRALRNTILALEELLSESDTETNTLDRVTEVLTNRLPFVQDGNMRDLARVVCALAVGGDHEQR